MCLECSRTSPPRTAADGAWAWVGARAQGRPQCSAGLVVGDELAASLAVMDLDEDPAERRRYPGSIAALAEAVSEDAVKQGASMPPPTGLLARRIAAANRQHPERHHRRDPGRRHEQDKSPDALARMAAGFRSLLQRVEAAVEACKSSHLYGVLTRTTQPAHLVTFVSVALVAALLFPSTLSSRGDADADAGPAEPREPSPWTRLAYIVSFAAHFGSQFWMTFVSGLSLFFSLPRHHFAEVQKVLFPLYFAINSSFSLVTLASFLRLHSQAWDAQVCAQVSSMVLCFLIELLVRLYLTPPLLLLITAKTDMEKTVEGVGQEVGRYDLGPLTQCPHYLKIHSAFRKVHTGIALANIVAMGCTAFHAHFVASKVSL